MKQKNFIKNLIILICLTGALFSYGQQVTIYSEDFTGQEGKGATGGTPPTVDLTGVDWNIDISSANIAGSTSWFKVKKYSGNDLFESSNFFQVFFRVSILIGVFCSSLYEDVTSATFSGLGSSIFTSDSFISLPFLSQD